MAAPHMNLEFEIWRQIQKFEEEENQAVAVQFDEKNEKNRLSFITIIIILNYNIFITNTIPWFPIYFLPKYLRTRFYYLEERKKRTGKKSIKTNSRRS